MIFWGWIIIKCLFYKWKWPYSLDLGSWRWGALKYNVCEQGGHANNCELCTPSFINTLELDELEEEYALGLGRELSSLFDENVLTSIDLIVIEENFNTSYATKRTWEGILYQQKVIIKPMLGYMTWSSGNILIVRICSWTHEGPMIHKWRITMY